MNLNRRPNLVGGRKHVQVARKDALCDGHLAAHCISCATFTPP